MKLIDKIFKRHNESVSEESITDDASIRITEEVSERRVIVEEVPEGISVSEGFSPKTLARCMFAIKQQILQMIGPEFYNRKLEEFEPELADAYKSVDFWMLKTKCAEAELEYYRACNDPNGFHGPQLREMHDRVCELRNYIEELEQSGQAPDVHIDNVKDMFSDIHNSTEDDIDEITGEDTRLKKLDEAMRNHEKVSIFMDAPMPNTMPSLPINFD
jgi:hypothetical protein